jgi:hypothetical protein
MKKSILTLIVIVLSIAGFAQGKEYPKGAYMSLEEIKARTPSVQLDLQVERRTDGNIKMVGGNDYKLSSDDKNIKRSFFKKQMWAYSDGKTLFLNCSRLKVRPWYANVINDGRYLVFRGAMSQEKDVMKKQQSQDMAIGMMFGAIGGGLAGMEMAMMRFLYVLDKDTGEVIAIDQRTMNILLGDVPQLLDAFLNEPNRTEEETWIRYLRLLNSEAN